MQDYIIFNILRCLFFIRGGFFFIGSWKLEVGTGRGLSEVSVASLLMVGSGVQGLRGSGAQGFRGSGVQGFRGSGVQGFRGSRVQGFKGSRVQGFKGSRVQ